MGNRKWANRIQLKKLNVEYFWIGFLVGKIKISEHIRMLFESMFYHRILNGITPRNTWNRKEKIK